ncbi:DUF4913 domain-containing protein [Pseudarthrobacter enclensis]|nr:DUF4913 domain-containing protein [Pseudarthrobacter enclensis]
MSAWWRDYRTTTCASFSTRKGPFYTCDRKEHRDPDHLERRMAPAG